MCTLRFAHPTLDSDRLCGFRGMILWIQPCYQVSAITSKYPVGLTQAGHCSGASNPSWR